jgi:hypothetical protein
MDLQIKVFRWPNQANHVIMLARGTIDIEGFTQIFRRVAQMSAPPLDWKILIDLLDAKCTIEAGDIDKFFREPHSDRLSHGSKVALVAARASKHYDHLATISASLSKHGFSIAIFEDSNVAAEWLVGHRIV